MGALPLRPGALPAGPAPSPPPLPALLHAGGWHSPTTHWTGGPGATQPQGKPTRGVSCTAPGHPMPGGGDRAGEGHAGRDGEQSQHPSVDGGGHTASRNKRHHSTHSWVCSGGTSCWALLQGPLTGEQERRWQGWHPPCPFRHHRAACTTPAPCLGRRRWGAAPTRWREQDELLSS